jgi:hypothetical protein
LIPLLDSVAIISAFIRLNQSWVVSISSIVCKPRDYREGVRFLIILY